MGLLFNIGTKSYRRIFANRFFYKWNRWVLLCGLKGLGINNFTDRFSGEFPYLKKTIQKKKNPVLIDVGANVGKWSQKALEINPTSKIFAFEPNPESYKILSQISQIEALNVACGAQEGRATIYRKSDDPTWPLASLQRDAISRLTDDMEETEIQVTTLDQFIESQKIENVDLLKIDVEGYEYNVLEGCKESIKKGVINTIQFEFNDMNLYTRRFFNDFKKLLPDFVFYRLLPKGKIPLRDYDAYLSEIFSFQNIVAIREKH